jgi:hypothetical protein
MIANGSNKSDLPLSLRAYFLGFGKCAEIFGKYGKCAEIFGKCGKMVLKS